MASKKRNSRYRPIGRVRKASRKQLQASKKQYGTAKKQATAYKKLAKSLGKFSPDIGKLARKKRLTAADKQRISKRAKRLHNVTDLFRITGKGAKKFKQKFGDIFYPGTEAVRLRYASENATIKFVDDNLFLESNGRQWLYWRLNKSTVRNKDGKLVSAAEKAFDAQFPIEKVLALAERAYTELKIEAITLWTEQGRADTTFSELRDFARWVAQHWQNGNYIRYDTRTGEIHDESDAGKWINGLAILLKEPPKRAKRKASVKRKTVKRKRKSTKGKRK